jgi:hypothetical protein
MHLSLLHFLLACAGLVQVSARSIIVDVVQAEAVTTNLRFGHPVPGNDFNADVATFIPLPGAGLEKQKGRSRPCSNRFRYKAISISNAFKKAFGIPLVEASQKSDASTTTTVVEGTVHILPFIGTPPTFVKEHHHHHGKHLGGGRHHFEDGSFLRRVHFALMALGPWEGRAVAFVLGCGIGVLLRMLFVMTVISYRMIKGNREDRNEYTHIICEHYADAEEIFVAPPNYVVTDEKAPIVVEGIAPTIVEQETK